MSSAGRGLLAHRLRFAGHQRLIDVQLGRLDQPAVGGDLVAHFQHDHVADDDVLQRHGVELRRRGCTLTRSDSLLGVEHLELAVALVLAEEGDAGGQDDGDHDGQPFDRGRGRVARPTKNSTRAETNSSDGTHCACLQHEQAADDADDHDAERRRRRRPGCALNRSTTIDSRAAASRILMIGSSNFSRNFFQSGSRGSGVRRLAPNCCRLWATASGGQAGLGRRRGAAAGSRRSVRMAVLANQ